MAILSTDVRFVMDKIRTFVCVCDGAGGILYVNKAGQDLLRSPNEGNIVGRPMTDFVAADFVEILEEGLGVFADEADGVPLKIRTVTNVHIDVFFYVEEIDDEEIGTGYLVECQDVSNFIVASEAARSRESRLNTVLKVVDQAVISIDEFGAITGFNDAAVNVFGYDKASALGQNVKMLMPEPVRSEHDDYLFRYLSGGPSKILNVPREVDCVRADGSLFPAELTVTEHAEREGRRSFIGMVRDISQRKAQEERIRFLAMHDTLTSLPNRNKFNDHFHDALARAKRASTKLALMFVDLDKFKPINDTFGHDAGDHVLKVTATRLAESIRETDMAARIGGDEFVLLIEGVSDGAAIEKIAAKVLEAVRRGIEFDGNDCSVGASIGISLYPDHGSDEESLTKKADEAMYAVKAAGRNAFAIAD